jgi:phosphodiesterase/alkaline phosphatase D-like protein
VDPNAAGTVSDCHFEYGTDTSYNLGSTPCTPAAPITSPTDVSANISGLTPFKSYHYRLVAIRSDGKGFPKLGHDRTFTPVPSGTPTIDSTSSSGVETTNATLNGVVNPQSSPTVYHFEYGTDTSYGSQTLTGESIGEDAAGHPVSSVIANLEPGATYHYRLIATNFNGTTTGPDETFTTPGTPTIVQTTVAGVSQTGVTLIVRISPGLRGTTFHIEFGLNSSYEARTAESASIGADDTVHTVNTTIGGLEPGTEYHYRVVAANEVGSTAGPDGRFTTGSAPAVVPPPSAACKQGYVRRHGTCVKKPHHKRTHHHRRSGR